MDLHSWRLYWVLFSSDDTTIAGEGASKAIGSIKWVSDCDTAATVESKDLFSV